MCFTSKNYYSQRWSNIKKKSFKKRGFKTKHFKLAKFENFFLKSDESKSLWFLIKKDVMKRGYARSSKLKQIPSAMF